MTETIYERPLYKVHGIINNSINITAQILMGVPRSKSDEYKLWQFADDATWWAHSRSVMNIAPGNELPDLHPKPLVTGHSEVIERDSTHMWILIPNKWVEFWSFIEEYEQARWKIAYVHPADGAIKLFRGTRIMDLDPRTHMEYMKRERLIWAPKRLQPKFP